MVGAGGIWQMAGVLAKVKDEEDENLFDWQFRICVGCEDGRVRIYTITQSGACALLSTSLRYSS